MKKRVVLYGIVLLMVLTMVVSGAGLVQASTSPVWDPMGRWGVLCEPLSDGSGCGGG